MKPRKIMVPALRRIALAAMLSVAFAARLPAVPAAELVTVASHAFATRQPLLGYLARPFGKGPFPAVVLLHGCGGFGPRETRWADRLRVWGYVALAVDSFTPRNRTGCNGPMVDVGGDGFAALHYLATLPFVLPDRVAVLGSSLGGIAALGDVENNALEPDQHLKFHAAVAFYPSCTGDSGQVDAPTLILIGEKDDWAWAQACRTWSRMRPGTAPRSIWWFIRTPPMISMFQPRRRTGSSAIISRTDAAATQDAEQRVRDFLSRALR